MTTLSATQIRARFPDNAYVAYHAPRYALILKLLQQYPAQRLLDIGPSALTTLLHQQIGIPVDTLGWEPDGATTTGMQYAYNLNESQSPETWRSDLPQYDTIVFAEVLEHLYTSPTCVLKFLASLLAPHGILILQTPNALSLHKRLMPLLGIHPYPKISENPKRPSHYREYTKKELKDYAQQGGLTMLYCETHHYFDYRYLNHNLPGFSPLLGETANLAYRCLPGPLKTGITMVLQKPA